MIRLIPHKEVPGAESGIGVYRGVVERPFEQRSDRLLITIAVGSEYERICNLTSGLMSDYARKCSADFIVLRDRTQSWPLYEKFRVGNYARQYQQTLFVDVDCVIRPTCPDLFSIVPPGHVAMHDDTPHNLDYQWLERKWDAVMKSQSIFRPLSHDPVVTLNTGVVLCDKATSFIWSPPEKELPGSHEDEQIWVQGTIQDRGVPVMKLPQMFHHQAYFRDFKEFLPQAQIVHFALAGDRVSRIADFIGGLG